MVEPFGRFWLQERVGESGGAEVYRATVGPDSETYAFDFTIARLLPARAEVAAEVEAFLALAEVGELLSHPNLVRVFESGRVDGRP